MARIILGYPYNREKLFSAVGHPSAQFFKFAEDHYGNTVDPRVIELMWQEGRDGNLRLTLWGTPDEASPVLWGRVVAEFNPAMEEAYFVDNFPALFSSKWVTSAKELGSLAFDLGLIPSPEHGVSFLLTKLPVTLKEVLQCIPTGCTARVVQSWSPGVDYFIDLGRPCTHTLSITLYRDGFVGIGDTTYHTTISLQSVLRSWIKI